MSDRANPRQFSFGLRRLFVVVAVFALVLGAWQWLIRWPSVTISGAGITRERVVQLLPDHLPDYLEVRIFGRINGQATITDPWRTTTTVGPGEFDLAVANEYYDTAATIKYSPTTVTSGHLTVEYNFDPY